MNENYYGYKGVPVIDLENIKAPVAMFVGIEDEFASPIDARWARDQIGDNVIHYQEYDRYDHFTFQIGKDMHYIDDMLSLLAYYNPLD